MATAALIVAVLSLGWQVMAWLASQRPRVKVDVQLARASTQRRYLVSYDEGVPTPGPTEGSGRGALLARVHNRGVHAFEVTDVAFEPSGGTGGGLHVSGLPEPDPAAGLACTIPGTVAGHSQGLIWVYVDDLAATFEPDAKVEVRVGLGSGKVVRSQPVAMAELLALDRPEAIEPT